MRIFFLHCTIFLNSSYSMHNQEKQNQTFGFLILKALEENAIIKGDWDIQNVVYNNIFSNTFLHKHEASPDTLIIMDTCNQALLKSLKRYQDKATTENEIKIILKKYSKTPRKTQYTENNNENEELLLFGFVILAFTIITIVLIKR